MKKKDYQCSYITLLSNDKLTELENELKRHILGLREVRRTGEHLLKLKSGHILYSKGQDEAKMCGIYDKQGLCR